MSRQFQAVLNKLVDDEQYREQVKVNPQRIISDFQFTDAELSLLVTLGQTANDDLAAGSHARMALASSSSSGGGPGAAKPNTSAF